MLQINETYFSTGEFAKLCKTTKTTLFYYNDIGLFSPKKISEGGYLLYSPLQIDEFHEISFYKTLDISLKNIKQLMLKRSPDNFISFSDQQLKQIDKNIQNLNKLKEALTNKASFIKKVYNLPLYDIEISYQESQPLSYVIKTDGPCNYDDYIDFLKELFHLNFKHHHGAIINKNNLLHNSSQHIAFYTVVEDNIFNHSEIEKPQGHYAIAYHIGDTSTINDTYQKLLTFIDKNSLSLESNFYEEYLIGSTLANKTSDYITKISVLVNAKI